MARAKPISCPMQRIRSKRDHCERHESKDGPEYKRIDFVSGSFERAFRVWHSLQSRYTNSSYPCVRGSSPGKKTDRVKNSLISGSAPINLFIRHRNSETTSILAMRRPCSQP